MEQKVMATIRKWWLIALLLFVNFQAFAQTQGFDVNVDVNKGGDQWYANPWAWIVGAAVFILLLVAIVRGGRASD